MFLITSSLLLHAFE